MTEQKKELTAFEKLCELDVSKYTEKKNGLTYLSWTYAWKAFKKTYPNATYEITHWDGHPYLFDENLGYMIETTVSNGTESHTMWLPVMDSANHAQKHEPYEIITASGKKIVVKAATMFDINTTIMRCLVKNIAMFGLGLYIYAGEDLPELSETTIAEQKAQETEKKIATMKERIKLMLDSLPPELDTSAFAKYESVDDVAQLTAMGVALKKICETQGATNANN